MRHPLLVSIIFTLAIILIPLQIVDASEEITIQPAIVQFGENILFQASLPASQQIKNVQIYFQEKSNPTTTIKPASFHLANDSTSQIEYLLDLKNRPLRAFSKIEYHFEVELMSGEVLTSETTELDYIDDRYNWQTKTEAPFQVHWYEGDFVSAQKALDTAQTGLQRIETIIPATETVPVDIYIYSNSTDMQETFQQAGMNWVAGHADPDLGVVVVSLPPGPDQEMLTEQRIPHELMHVMLYRYLKQGYANLPTWLSEGLASFMELMPNPDYQVLLDSAYQKDRLIPIDLLCKNFPREASGALLAYAQSESFVSFINDAYGANGLQALINQYSMGLDCAHGAQNALGISLSRLDRQWREERFGENAIWIAIKKLLPWLALMGAILIAPVIMLIGWLRRRPDQAGQKSSAG